MAIKVGQRARDSVTGYVGTVTDIRPYRSGIVIVYLDAQPFDEWRVTPLLSLSTVRSFARSEAANFEPSRIGFGFSFVVPSVIGGLAGYALTILRCACR